MLSIDDFEALSTKELLDLKGGGPPAKLSSGLPWGGGNGEGDDEGGGGGSSNFNNCAKCKEAYDKNGTPVPGRCNGASHFSMSSAISSGLKAMGLSSFANWLYGQTSTPKGVGMNKRAAAISFATGYGINSAQQFIDYYNYDGGEDCN